MDGRVSGLQPILAREKQSKKVIRVNEGELIPFGAKYLSSILIDNKIVSLYEIGVEEEPEKISKVLKQNMVK